MAETTNTKYTIRYATEADIPTILALIHELADYEHAADQRGYGKALLAALARECVRIGGGRVEWSVLKWNEPSLQFYQSEAIGATRMEEWVGMRVEGEEAIRKLAAAADE
ncbi:hypothetical protein DV737_g1661, partial [Chaetothyriales sp. CBS 132003]